MAPQELVKPEQASPEEPHRAELLRNANFGLRCFDYVSSAIGMLQNGEWLIKTCVHRYSDDGYRVDLTLELPNKDAPPDVSERQLKAPKVGKDQGLDDDGPAGVITLPPA